MPAKNQLKNVLFLFAFNVPLVEFICMLWVIILHEYRSLTHKPRSCWDRVMLQFVVIAGLFQFVPFHHRASSMLYGWCDARICSSFTNSSLHIDPPIWAKDFELWFISPKDFIPLLSLWLPWPTGAFCHCFASSKGVSWQQFCHICQFHRNFSSQ